MNPDAKGWTITFAVLTAGLFACAAADAFALGALSWIAFAGNIAGLAIYAYRWGRDS